MSSGKINRFYARKYHETIITYVNMKSGNHHYAKMTSNSIGGMSFFSDTELKPGSDIFIKKQYFSPNIYTHDSDTGCHAKVIWCNKSSEEKNTHSSSNYEIGVKYNELLT